MWIISGLQDDWISGERPALCNEGIARWAGAGAVELLGRRAPPLPLHHLQADVPGQPHHVRVQPVWQLKLSIDNW